MSSIISIIVPVYGVELYIERCAKSLFEQTYQGVIEYIFINDKTPDESMAVLNRVIEDYPNRKPFVKILQHDNNKGLPQSRKTGMLAAKGDYIISVDSDDWINPEMVEKLMAVVESEDPDIVVYDYASVNDKGDLIRILRGCKNQDRDSFIMDMCSMRVAWSACNKMFRRSLLTSQILFPEGNMGEDMALMTQIVLSAFKITYLPEVMYYYYVNPLSMTQVSSIEGQLKKYYQLKENTCIAIDAFERNDMASLFSDSLFALKWNLRKCLWGLVYIKEYYELWKNTFPEIEYKVLLNSQISIHDKICYLLTLCRLYPRKQHRVIG